LSPQLYKMNKIFSFYLAVTLAALFVGSALAQNPPPPPGGGGGNPWPPPGGNDGNP